MSRSKRLTDADRMEIVREAAEGVSTSVLAERFGVSVRAIQYTLKADASVHSVAGNFSITVSSNLYEIFLYATPFARRSSFAYG